MNNSSEEPLGRLLSLTTKVVQQDFDLRLAAYGGGLTTFLVLKYALEGEGLTTQRALARGMGIEAPTLVRHIDRLELEGYVERRRDEQDRRAVRVVVTPAGKKLWSRLVEGMAAANGELVGLLTANEERVLRRALTKVRTHYTTKREEGA